MKSFLLALAVGQTLAAAVPPQLNQGTKIVKRQSADLVSALSALMGPSGGLLGSTIKGTLGEFKGSEQATEAYMELAKSMGATEDKAGYMGVVSNLWTNQGYGKVQPSAGSAPRREDKPARTKVAGSQSVKMRYGPYKVQNSTYKSAMDEYGMLANYVERNIEKPCVRCTLLGMTAGLEYENGKNANIDTGLWLHHMVMFNVGDDRQDATCHQREISVPHVFIGETPRNSERFFLSGNERTPVMFTEWGVGDAGYNIKTSDKLAVIIDIMNDTPRDVVTWLTIQWDFIDGHPYDYEIKPIWLDARQCGTSEVNPPAGQKKFTIDYKWKSDVAGQIVGTIEHLHDGGTNMTVSIDGRLACDSESLYGTKPEYISAPMAPMAPAPAPATSGTAAAGGHAGHGSATPPGAAGGGHGHSMGAGKHISVQKACYGPSLLEKTLKIGQTVAMSGYYDYNKYPGQVHEDGKPDEVMGLGIVYYRVRR
ncbi:hypothetical protein BT63DRAFT_417021 [Microthyrium microscopicum]|uniref:Uncharacterized protein n=1 Tax=Microthyrium microscopicum TaxID=703497 RepID=A0A6A6U1I2_9PEZI|nr:hypothetical protein BT63DRAFT_417021 [Microthyrium microscopicum]